MIVSTLIAAAVAAQPAPPPQPTAAPAPSAEKKMACCEKMSKGEGCECCKEMEHKTSAPAKNGHEGHSSHDH